MRFQNALYLGGGLRGDDDCHSDPAVEGSPHFRVIDPALLGKPIEDRGDGPGINIKGSGLVVRQNSRQIFAQSAAGNMCQRPDAATLDRGKTASDINARRH